MARIFDNYNNGESNNPCFIYKPTEQKLVNDTSTEASLNIKNQLQGLHFSSSKPINLEFIFEGEVITNSGEIISAEDFINSNNIKFELLDFKLHPVITICTKGKVNNGILLISIDGEESKNLKNGNYYIRMSVLCDGSLYKIFSPGNAVINIGDNYGSKY